MWNKVKKVAGWALLVYGGFGVLDFFVSLVVGALHWQMLVIGPLCIYGGWKLAKPQWSLKGRGGLW